MKYTFYSLKTSRIKIFNQSLCYKDILLIRLGRLTIPVSVSYAGNIIRTVYALPGRVHPKL